MPETNLPLQTTTFIGRKSELAEVVSLLKKLRLVTIVASRAYIIPATALAMLTGHRAKLAEQRLAIGPAYKDYDFVIAEADGSPMDPDGLTKGVH